MHYAMMAYGEVDVQIHVFWTVELVADEWSASHPGRFTTRERAPCTHWIAGSVRLSADPDIVEKTKLFTLLEFEL
jgi:hypothetical protein